MPVKCLSLFNKRIMFSGKKSEVKLEKEKKSHSRSFSKGWNKVFNSVSLFLILAKLEQKQREKYAWKWEMNEHEIMKWQSTKSFLELIRNALENLSPWAQLPPQPVALGNQHLQCFLLPEFARTSFIWPLVLEAFGQTQKAPQQPRKQTQQSNKQPTTTTKSNKWRRRKEKKRENH